MESLPSVPLPEAESLAFFDVETGVTGVIGPQIAVMHSSDGKIAYSVSEDGLIGSAGPGKWSSTMTSIHGGFDLEWSSTGAGAALDSSQLALCQVAGKLTEHNGRERRFKSLGAVTMPSRRPGPPILRSITAVFDAKTAFVLNAYRPAVYHGHGDERNDAFVIENGEPRRVNDARLSTVYNKDDMHTRASLELWVEGEEFPRRITGEAIENTHVELTDRDVSLAFYKWTMGPHTGLGVYEIALAAPPRVAA